MTSDTPTGDQATTEAGSTPPRRATRRRVTRPTSAPQTTGPAPIVVPAAVVPETPAPADDPTEQPTTPATPQPEQTPAAEDVPATGPARRSRRATRRTAGPAAAATADSATSADASPAAASNDRAASPEQITLPERASETSGAAASLSLDDIVLPGGPASTTSSSAAGSGKKSPRATSADESEPPKRSRSRTARKTADVPADAEQVSETVAAPKRRRASRASGEGRADAPVAEPAAARSAAPEGDAPTAPAADATPTPEPATAPTEAGTGAPRLATTALLFQAPEMSGPRRSRRAQAPAGPPRVHDADVATESDAGPAPEPVEEPAADAATAKSKRSAKKSGAGRGRRSTKAAADEIGDAPADEQESAPVEPAAGPGAPEEAEPITLSEAEEAAVSELELIETELQAEGITLPELLPEDFREDGDESDIRPRRRRRRGGRGRRGGRKVDQRELDDEDDQDEDGEDSADEPVPAGEASSSQPPAGRRSGQGEEPAEPGSEDESDRDTEPVEDAESSGSSRRRRRRRRSGRGGERESGRKERADDEVTALKGSTRLEAKRQRRRDGRDAGRRRQVITEAEFLARRESVKRSMFVREEGGRTQIAVLEDGVLVEHYVSQQEQASMVGNVYLGRVQNVLPSMEAAFVDVGKGRNAVLYAGEVNWDAAGVEGQPRRIEEALKSGDSVLVQVTKDPIGHKGARLTSQITLAGRYLVFVPGGGMTGISRKLPDTERSRLKKILRDVVPEGAGVIVRTAAEGASEDELRADVERLESQWQAISAQAEKSSTSAPSLLQGEPDMAIRVVRDIFNDDFTSLVVQGDHAWSEISSYVAELAPDLRERVSKWNEPGDVFARHRVDEQLAKGMDRKVWLPSGGSLVIDRTEAMTVVDVNTGKFTGSGGTLEETVTRNNLEAAEEIVRQLRLRDIGGIIVIDFVDMVLESNRDLVLRRLVECLGRDRTKHQVAEVTSLGLVQMTRKRVGQGLVEAFSSTCEHCKGRGFIVHSEPIERGGAAASASGDDSGSKRPRRKRGAKKDESPSGIDMAKLPEDKSEAREAVKATLATIAAAAAHAHDHEHDGGDEDAQAAPADRPEPVTEETAAEAGAAVEAAVDAIVLPEPAAEPVETPVAEPEAAAPADEPAPSSGPEAEPSKGAGAEEAPEQADVEAAALTDTP
ncbi:Rne/Rng family ribonuclease [Isoptericola croceus]|uniref:Rne/Rng family ribonuclease n=1 Tax=Isoptericola croceus TaxID=3031406 RepID=UPI0023F9B7D5|nr:ribonuclease E/G [Isoptericola croceus]